jgi:hypothetical protein
MNDGAVANRSGGSSFGAVSHRRCAPFILPALLAIHFTLQACSLPTSGRAPLIVRSSSITLAWDAPSTAGSMGKTIAGFYVYWRPHLTEGWCLAGQVPAGSSPRLRIEHADLGNGAFDFAVTSLDSAGNESVFHASTDMDADPFGGWYVIWEGPLEPFPEGE